MTKDLFKN